ncbi:hypothetical protein [Acinetobacter colistiniresistens]|uniref:hypothetical protein n=1 Tax=Acinetobacter colistiniresistens TaxID=280145 RepID=UPI000DD0DB89|nr:hypothetical protein [Acinetobacter colistiniresistens]
MKQEVRNSYIARLSEEISGSLAGNNFERFGYIISDHYFSDYEMINKGTNVDGAPVGHIVDSVSTDASVVTEYSSEKDYFSNLKKIKKDIKHSFNHYKGSLTKLLLLGSSSCRPKMQTLLNKRAARIKKHLNFEIIVWDSRMISEYIIDEMLFDESDIGRLSYYLPYLRQIRNESILNLSLPQKFDKYVSREEIEDPLVERLQSGESIVISGLGGSGKSSLANSIAHKIKYDFEIVIWLDASSVERLEDLGAWDLYRNSHILNLLGIIKSRRCLLILDNLSINSSTEELEGICSNNSVIIATRREVHFSSDYNLPLLDENSARQILENNIGTACPDEIFALLYELIGGYPLVYSLMNANLISGEYEWEDIRLDCDSIHQYSDDKNKLLAERLLGHLGEAYKNELSFIRSCRGKQIDSSFAKSAIRPIGISKLKRSAVLTQASRDLLKIHDIVYEILGHINLDDFDISNEMSDYLTDKREKDWSSFLKVSCRHEELISYLLKENKTEILQYSHIISRNPADVEITCLQNLDEQLDSIRGACNNQSVSIKASLILETIEVLYRVTRDGEGENSWEKAQAFLKTSLSIYDELVSLEFVDASLKAIIKHHKAKALLWINDEESKCQAKIIFSELSSQETHLREAQLQLARILIKENDSDGAKDLIESILDSPNSQDNKASISVYLATFELLSRKQLSTFRSEFNNRFSRTVSELIKESMSYGYDQAYRAFSVFSQNWSFQKPEEFLDLFGSLSLPNARGMKDDYAKRSIANLYLQAGKVYESQCMEKAKPMFFLALEYYDHIGNKNAFDKRRIAEIYCRACEHETSEKNSLALFEENNEDPFVLYWLSKAQFNLDKFPDSLLNIEAAINYLKTDNVQYKSSFLELQSDILKGRGDENYVEILKEAIAVCDDDKYKGMLIDKLP